MNRLLILLFGMISTLAVGALLATLYRYAESDTLEKPAPNTHTDAFEKTSKADANKISWLKKLAKKEKPDFSYPVTEMEMALPLLKQSSAKKRQDAYTIRHLDAYKAFCLRQILDSEGCRYVLLRKRSDGILILHETDQKRLRKIMEKLREFEISLQKDNG